MKPSARQLAVYDTWRDTNSNILIQAVAGSGKTTVLMQIMEYCEHRTLYVAFNKSIQEETQAKIESKGYSQGKAMTIHSIGLSAIRHAGYKYKVDNSKNYKLLRVLFDTHKQMLKKYVWEDRLKLMFTLMDMNDLARLYLVEDKSELITIMLNMDKFPFEGKGKDLDQLWSHLKQMRADSYNEDTISIDFTDMIYLPVLADLEIPIYPTYLLLDEIQDFNLCQHKIIDKLLSQGTIEKWVGVGDKNQSIYGFSGAYDESFDLFKDKSTDVVELTLDINYRCPVDVVSSANEVYNIMKGFKTELGIVKTIFDVKNIKPKSMVVCRNRNPLVALYFALIKEGIPSVIIGDDISSSITKFLKPYNKSRIKEARNGMDNDLMATWGKVLSEEESRKQYYLIQNIENFDELVKNLNVSTSDTVEVLLKKMEVLFQNKEDAITLCTIHKAKGLESDFVYILNENLIPSKFAKSSQQLKQEQNLKYVARTRAMKEMYFLNLDL